MKDSKKILSLLCAVASIALVGCKPTETPTSSTPSSSQPTTSASTPSSEQPASTPSSEQPDTTPSSQIDYSISQITTVGTHYTVRGVVVAKNTKTLLVHDGVAGISIFDQDSVGQFNVGDYVEVSATLVEAASKSGSFGYNQFSYSSKDLEIKKIDGEKPNIPAPVPLTAAIADSWATTPFSVTESKAYTWTTTVGEDGNYLTYNIEGSNTVIEAPYLPTDFDFEAGKKYTVTGYFVAYQTNHNYVNMILTAAEPVSVPATAVTLSASKTELNIGETATLTAQVTPADSTDEVSYEITEGADLATIAGDVLTAAKEGTVKVVAKAGSVTSEAVTITITAPVSVEVTFSKSEDAINVDSTLDLNALLNVVVPEGKDKSVTWASDDEKVATVVDGVVTGVKAGVANITATSVADSTKSASIQITVKDVDYSIGQIKAAGNYTVRGVVDGLTTQGMIITDGKNSIYYYGGYNATGLQPLGTKVEVTGNVASYNGAFQFSASDKTPAAQVTVIESGEFTPAAPVALTADIANSWAADGATFTTEDVKKYTWTATVGTQGGYETINIKDSETIIEPVYLDKKTFDIKEGWTYTVTGYFSGYNSKNKYASIVVTDLKDGVAPALTGIKISGANQVQVGKTVTLKAAAEPSSAVLGEVTWSTGDKEIATVDKDGVVTGVKAGKTTITAKSGEISGTFEITVTTEAPAVQPLVADYTKGWEDGASHTSDFSGNNYNKDALLTALNSGGTEIAVSADEPTNAYISDKVGGIKLGASRKIGSVKFTAVRQFTKITVKAVGWPGHDSSFTINSSEAQSLSKDTDGTLKSAKEFTVTLDAATDVVEIATVSGKTRIVIVGITLE